MKLILHITSHQQWEEAKILGIYQGETLQTEGFIHCSTPQQIVTVANRFFRGKKGLLLLQIDEEKVQEEVRYESVDGDYFPHLYGALNLDAVVQVAPFEPEEDGIFSQDGVTFTNLE